MTQTTDLPGAARLTPYELVFGADLFEQRLFPEMSEEVRLSGTDPNAPDRFTLLTSVGRLVHEIVPEDTADGENPAEIAQEIGHLVYQAWQFWRFDRELIVLDPGLARRIAAAPAPIGRWELMPPAPAGYLQLPRNLFWARIVEDATPEPVDGFFWAMVGSGDPRVPPFPRIDVLLVLGLRPGRAGFGVIDVGAELPDAVSGHFGDVQARPGGGDFANVLPGGDLGELHALVTSAEVLKLVSHCFWQAALAPDALGESTRPTTKAEDASSLAFRVLRGAVDG